LTENPDCVISPNIPDLVANLTRLKLSQILGFVYLSTLKAKVKVKMKRK